jgi:uncharacterized protein YbjT (DUF2867 family)
VKLSAIGAEQPALLFSRWHAHAERALVDSGVSWTMLRPGSFMTNALHWAASIKNEGRFYAANGQGRLALVHPSDIAAVAVLALTQPGHQGRGYTLTGPEAHTADEHAAILSDVLGTPVIYADSSPAAMETRMRAVGLPAPFIAGRLDMMRAIREGRAAEIADPVHLLGRPARRFVDWIRENLSAFR